ncbi:MAG: hypothetical protein Q3972_01445 [Corynebacterium sp.]|nr:hypothetical protein [Corynebacterium sp.]
MASLDEFERAIASEISKIDKDERKELSKNYGWSAARLNKLDVLDRLSRETKIRKALENNVISNEQLAFIFKKSVKFVQMQDRVRYVRRVVAQVERTGATTQPEVAAICAEFLETFYKQVELRESKVRPSSTGHFEPVENGETVTFPVTIAKSRYETLCATMEVIFGDLTKEGQERLAKLRGDIIGLAVNFVFENAMEDGDIRRLVKMNVKEGDSTST